MSAKCSINDCQKHSKTCGLCGMHWWRWRHKGDPLWERTAEYCFWKGVEVNGSCWEFRPLTQSRRYGSFTWGGKTHLAHRWAWGYLVGPIPDGLQLDHLCRNTRCVNPDHLEPVTARTNTLRGFGPSAANVAKTHCPRGHEYSPENTQMKGGARSCRTCARDYARRKRAEVKAAA